MKNLLLQLVLYSILLNLSIGLMINVIPAFNDMDAKLGIDASTVIETMDDGLLDEFGDPLNGYPAMEDADNVNTNTLTDRVGLGAIMSIYGFFNRYMFGFVSVIQTLFGPHVNAAIFTVLKSIIFLVYVIAGIELFTGKGFN